MELNEAIELRRSTRKFKKKRIKKKEIIELIESARLAPSAANRQPWYFVILEKEKKDEIADIMEKELKKQKVKKDSTQDPTKPYDPTSSLIGSIEVIREAPILILVFREKRDIWLRGDYLSIGCAIENICLKATDSSLASLIIRDIIYTNDLIAASVGHEDKELVVSLSIGYSDEFPYERHKKEIDKIMEWYEK